MLVLSYRGGCPKRFRFSLDCFRAVFAARVRSASSDSVLYVHLDANWRLTELTEALEDWYRAVVEDRITELAVQMART